MSEGDTDQSRADTDEFIRSVCKDRSTYSTAMLSDDNEESGGLSLSDGDGDFADYGSELDDIELEDIGDVIKASGGDGSAVGSRQIARGDTVDASTPAGTAPGPTMPSSLLAYTTGDVEGFASSQSSSSQRKLESRVGEGAERRTLLDSHSWEHTPRVTTDRNTSEVQPSHSIISSSSFLKSPLSPSSYQGGSSPGDGKTESSLLSSSTSSRIPVRGTSFLSPRERLGQLQKGMLSTQLGSGDPAVNQQQLSQRAASEKEAAPERRQDLWTGASGQSSRPTDPRLLPFSQVPPLVHDTVPLDIGSDRSAAVTPRHVPPPSPQAGGTDSAAVHTPKRAITPHEDGNRVTGPLRGARAKGEFPEFCLQPQRYPGYNIITQSESSHDSRSLPLALTVEDGYGKAPAPSTTALHPFVSLNEPGSYHRPSEEVMCPPRARRELDFAQGSKVRYPGVASPRTHGSPSSAPNSPCSGDRVLYNRSDVMERHFTGAAIRAAAPAEPPSEAEIQNNISQLLNKARSMQRSALLSKSEPYIRSTPPPKSKSDRRAHSTSFQPLLSQGLSAKPSSDWERNNMPDVHEQAINSSAFVQSTAVEPSLYSPTVPNVTKNGAIKGHSVMGDIDADARSGSDNTGQDNWRSINGEQMSPGSRPLAPIVTIQSRSRTPSPPDDVDSWPAYPAGSANGEYNSMPNSSRHRTDISRKQGSNSPGLRRQAQSCTAVGSPKSRSPDIRARLMSADSAFSKILHKPVLELPPVLNIGNLSPLSARRSFSSIVHESEEEDSESDGEKMDFHRPPAILRPQAVTRDSLGEIGDLESVKVVSTPVKYLSEEDTSSDESACSKPLVIRSGCDPDDLPQESFASPITPRRPAHNHSSPEPNFVLRGQSRLEDNFLSESDGSDFEYDQSQTLADARALQNQMSEQWRDRRFQEVKLFSGAEGHEEANSCASFNGLPCDDLLPAELLSEEESCNDELSDEEFDLPLQGKHPQGTSMCHPSIVEVEVNPEDSRERGSLFTPVQPFTSLADSTSPYSCTGTSDTHRHSATQSATPREGCLSLPLSSPRRIRKISAYESPFKTAENAAVLRDDKENINTQNHHQQGQKDSAIMGAFPETEQPQLSGFKHHQLPRPRGHSPREVLDQAPRLYPQPPSVSPLLVGSPSRGSQVGGNIMLSGSRSQDGDFRSLDNDSVADTGHEGNEDAEESDSEASSFPDNQHHHGEVKLLRPFRSPVQISQKGEDPGDNIRRRISEPITSSFTPLFVVGSFTAPTGSLPQLDNDPPESSHSPTREPVAVIRSASPFQPQYPSGGSSEVDSAAQLSFTQSIPGLSRFTPDISTTKSLPRLPSTEHPDQPPEGPAPVLPPINRPRSQSHSQSVKTGFMPLDQQMARMNQTNARPLRRTSAPACSDIDILPPLVDRSAKRSDGNSPGVQRLQIVDEEVAEATSTGASTVFNEGNSLPSPVERGKSLPEKRRDFLLLGRSKATQDADVSPTKPYAGFSPGAERRKLTSRQLVALQRMTGSPERGQRSNNSSKEEINDEGDRILPAITKRILPPVAARSFDAASTSPAQVVSPLVTRHSISSFVGLSSRKASTGENSPKLKGRGRIRRRSSCSNLPDKVERPHMERRHSLSSRPEPTSSQVKQEVLATGAFLFLSPIMAMSKVGSPVAMQKLLSKKLCAQLGSSFENSDEPTTSAAETPWDPGVKPSAYHAGMVDDAPSPPPQRSMSAEPRKRVTMKAGDFEDPVAIHDGVASRRGMRKTSRSASSLPSTFDDALRRRKRSYSRMVSTLPTRNLGNVIYQRTTAGLPPYLKPRSPEDILHNLGFSCGWEDSVPVLPIRYIPDEVQWRLANMRHVGEETLVMLGELSERLRGVPICYKAEVVSEPNSKRGLRSHMTNVTDQYKNLKDQRATIKRVPGAGSSAGGYSKPSVSTMDYLFGDLGTLSRNHQMMSHMLDGMSDVGESMYLYGTDEDSQESTEESSSSSSSEEDLDPNGEPRYQRESKKFFANRPKRRPIRTAGAELQLDYDSPPEDYSMMSPSPLKRTLGVLSERSFDEECVSSARSQKSIDSDQGSPRKTTFLGSLERSNLIPDVILSPTSEVASRLQVSAPRSEDVPDGWDISVNPTVMLSNGPARRLQFKSEVASSHDASQEVKHPISQHSLLDLPTTEGEPVDDGCKTPLYTQAPVSILTGAAFASSKLPQPGICSPPTGTDVHALQDDGPNETPLLSLQHQAGVEARDKRSVPTSAEAVHAESEIVQEASELRIPIVDVPRSMSLDRVWRRESDPASQAMLSATSRPDLAFEGIDRRSVSSGGVGGGSTAGAIKSSEQGTELLQVVYLPSTSRRSSSSSSAGCGCQASPLPTPRHLSCTEPPKGGLMPTGNFQQTAIEIRIQRASPTCAEMMQSIVASDSDGDSSGWYGSSTSESRSSSSDNTSEEEEEEEEEDEDEEQVEEASTEHITSRSTIDGASESGSLEEVASDDQTGRPRLAPLTYQLHGVITSCSISQQSQQQSPSALMRSLTTETSASSPGCFLEPEPIGFDAGSDAERAGLENTPTPAASTDPESQHGVALPPAWLSRVQEKQPAFPSTGQPEARATPRSTKRLNATIYDSSRFGNDSDNDSNYLSCSSRPSSPRTEVSGRLQDGTPIGSERISGIVGISQGLGVPSRVFSTSSGVLPDHRSPRSLPARASPRSPGGSHVYSVTTSHVAGEPVTNFTDESWRGRGELSSRSVRSSSSQHAGFDHSASELQSMAQLEEQVAELARRKEISLRELQNVQSQLARRTIDLKNVDEDVRGKSETIAELTIKRNALCSEIDSLSDGSIRLGSGATSATEPASKLLEEIAQLQEERTSLKLHIYQLVESAKQDGDLHQRLLAETKVNLERATTEAEIERRNHKEYVQVLKKDLESAQQSIRDVRREKEEAVARAKEEGKLLRQQELEAMKHKVIQDRAVDAERVKEREARHVQDIQRQLTNCEKELEIANHKLQSREEATVALSSQVRQLKKAAEMATSRQLDMIEAEKISLRNELRREKATAISKLQDSMKVDKQRELQELQERLHAEKQTAVNRAEKKMTSQLEDLQKTLRLKDEDLKSTRGLLREQEEATRVLGEKMRLQTRTQVKTAVEKEHEKCEKEFERERKRVREQHSEDLQRASGRAKEDVEKLKQKLTTTQASLATAKQEVDEQKAAVKQLQRDRTAAVNKAKEFAKQESKQDLAKIRQTLEHDASNQRDQLQNRNSQLEIEVRNLRAREAAAIANGKEIERRLDDLEHAVVTDLTDECRRCTVAWGGSPAMRRRHGDKSLDDTTGKGDKGSSSARHALALMRQTTGDLRRHLTDSKAELEKERQLTQRSKKDRLLEVSDIKEQYAKQLSDELERQRLKLEREHSAEKTEIEKVHARKFDQKLARAVEGKESELRARMQSLQKTYEEEQRGRRERMSDDVSIEVERRLGDQLKKIRLQHQKEIQVYVRHIDQLKRQSGGSHMARSTSSGTLNAESPVRMPRSRSLSSGLNSSFTSPDSSRRGRQPRSSSLRRTAASSETPERGIGRRPPPHPSPSKEDGSGTQPSRKGSSGRRELPKIPTTSAEVSSEVAEATPPPTGPDNIVLVEKLKESHQLIKKLQKRNKQLKYDYQQLQASSSTSNLDLSKAAGNSEHDMATDDTPAMAEMQQKLLRSILLLEQKEREVEELQEKARANAEIQLQLERQLSSFYENDALD